MHVELVSGSGIDFEIGVWMDTRCAWEMSYDHVLNDGDDS